MSNSPYTFQPADALRLLKDHPKRWLVPLVGMVVLATGYALLKPRLWEARQTMILRNEAVNNDQEPGRFRHPEEMKVSAETVMAVARSQEVLGRALASVDGAAPTALKIDALREKISLAAPNGVEFGKTELFHLAVKSRDAERSRALAAAISREMQHQLRAIRDAKAQSMIDELTDTASLAEAKLATTTARLAALESEVGADLADLRMLDVTGGGDSDMRRRLNELEAELRAANVQRRSDEQLHKLLLAAQHDPGHLLATPNRLLVSQPALRRLKDGLVDAQLRTAQLLGSMTEVHPIVQTARESEAAIRRHLHDELAAAIRGVEVDLALNAGRVEDLQQQRAELNGRLHNLARLRAEYSVLAAEMAHRTKLLEEARGRLATAIASQAGARHASLVTLVGAPVVGANPVGPSRATIVLVGLAGGLAAGLAVLFLSVPVGPRRGEADALPQPVAHRNGHAPRPATDAATIDGSWPQVEVPEVLETAAP